MDYMKIIVRLWIYYLPIKRLVIPKSFYYTVFGYPIMSDKSKTDFCCCNFQPVVMVIW
jgi:hypothetical protein